MHPHHIDYEAIQRRVVRRVQRRYRFFIHTAAFIIGIPLIGGGAAPAIFLFWIAAWVFHLLYYTYQNHLEAEIEREIERETDKAYKRKRETHDIIQHAPPVVDEAEDVIVVEAPDPRTRRPSWLGDDGELVGFDD
jgi:flagellar biosynthesis component FlhA